MPECTDIQIRHRKICTGDLNKKIYIVNRSISSTGGGVDFDIQRPKSSRKWAAVKTLTGSTLFSGVNTGEKITHIFYVRANVNIESNMYVLYKDKYYNITEQEDLDGNNEVIALYCSERGTSTKRGTFS